MSNEALVVFVIFAILALWELDRIRKNIVRIRVMIEVEQPTTLRAACDQICAQISSISQILENEITDGRERRMRESLQ